MVELQTVPSERILTTALRLATNRRPPGAYCSSIMNQVTPASGRVTTATQGKLGDGTATLPHPNATVDLPPHSRAILDDYITVCRYRVDLHHKRDWLLLIIFDLIIRPISCGENGVK